MSQPERTDRAAALRAAIANVEHYREHSILMLLGGIFTMASDGTLYRLRKELIDLEAARAK
jgi:hypothetical protein